MVHGLEQYVSVATVWLDVGRGRGAGMKRTSWVVCCLCVVGVVALWSGCSGALDTTAPPDGTTTDGNQPAAAVDDSLAPHIAFARTPVATDYGFTSEQQLRSLHTSLPADASGALRMMREDLGDNVWIEVTPHQRHAVPGVLRDGTVIFEGAAEATDVIFVFGRQHIEEFRVLRSADAPTATAYHVELGEGLALLRQRGDILEAVDLRGRVAFHTLPAVAFDALGERRTVDVALDETTNTFRVDLDTDGMTYPIYVDPTWVASPNGAWPSEAVVALEELEIGKSCVINGDIAVVDAGDELSIGKSTVVTGSVTGDEVEIKKNATINGDVSYNDLDNDGTINGNLITPLALPVDIKVPLFPPVVHGSDDVTGRQG